MAEDQDEPRMGCCVDGKCDPSSCMNLPDGKTCGDCVHVKRCVAIFGHKPEDRYCDWFPRKFQLARASVVTQEEEK